MSSFCGNFFDLSSDLATYINVEVVSPDNHRVSFHLDRDTPLEKMFFLYCQRQHVSITCMSFCYQGRELSPDDTPDSLEMGQEVKVYSGLRAR